LALILVRGRRQLVARNRGRGVFYTPGGKRDPGESDEEALVREVREELSVDLSRASLRPFGVFEAQAHGKPEGTMVRITCYTGEYCGELAPASEVEELRWVASSDRDVLSATGVLILDALVDRGLVDSIAARGLSRRAASASASTLGAHARRPTAVPVLDASSRGARRGAGVARGHGASRTPVPGVGRGEARCGHGAPTDATSRRGRANPARRLLTGSLAGCAVQAPSVRCMTVHAAAKLETLKE